MSDVKFDYPMINGYRWADSSPVLEDQLSAFIQTGFFPEDHLVLQPMAEPGFDLADLELIAPGLYALMYDPELGPRAEDEAHDTVAELRRGLGTEPEPAVASNASTPCETPPASAKKLSYTKEPSRAEVACGGSTLRMGHAGSEVAEIQRKLATYDGAIDRLYGPKTKAAVEDFQRSKGLTVTGEVDAATLEALDAAPYVGDEASRPELERTIPSGAASRTTEAPTTPMNPALDARFEAKHCEAKQSVNRAMARSAGNDYLAQGAVADLQKVEVDAARMKAKGGGSLEGYVTRFDAKLASTEQALEELRSRTVDMYSETGKTEAIGLNAQIQALETQHQELAHGRGRAQQEVDGLFDRLEKLSGKQVSPKGVYAQTFETYRDREVPELEWREGARGPLDLSIEGKLETAREATNRYGQNNPTSTMGEDARRRYTELKAQYEQMKAEGGGGLFGQTSRYEVRVNLAERRVKALVDELGAIDATRDTKVAKSEYQALFPRFRGAVDELTAAQKALADVQQRQQALADQLGELEKGYHHPVRMGFGMYAGMR